MGLASIVVRQAVSPQERYASEDWIGGRIDWVDPAHAPLAAQLPPILHSIAGWTCSLCLAAIGNSYTISAPIAFS